MTDMRRGCAIWGSRAARRAVRLWDRRRMVCDGCGRWFAEDHPALAGCLTARLARRLVADARERFCPNLTVPASGIQWPSCSAGARIRGYAS